MAILESPLFAHYHLDSAYDAMFSPDGVPRPAYQLLYERLLSLGHQMLEQRQQAVNLAFLNQGVTFTVYGDKSGTERIFPYDLVPRILTGKEWSLIERGLEQRLVALNLFLKDIYNEQKILQQGVVPRELVESCPNYMPLMRGVAVPHDVYVSIAGMDLVQLPSGEFAVLEDNLRVPSGASYMLGNRRVLKRMFPKMFAAHKVRPIEQYSEELLRTLRSLSPQNYPNPNIVLISPGVYNSAYYEHTFLARQMGILLVEGRDLIVLNDIVYVRTTSGLQRVDVIYRRINDEFLDPTVFRSDSYLGVPNLVRAFMAGNVTLANAIGTGVADDKAIYAYVPQMIRYYLGEEPLINNIDTYLLADEKQRNYVLDHLDELVVKAVGESGGYGMLIGPHASSEEIASFREKIVANPRNYIAQPTLMLSRAPCFLGETGMEARHVDLRPFVLYGDKVRVVPGGLTRVALKQGSLVVNSSQGGGSKDTWVLENDETSEERSA